MGLSFNKTAEFLEGVGMTRHAESRLRGKVQIEIVHTAGDQIRIGFYNPNTDQELLLFANPLDSEVVGRNYNSDNYAYGHH